MKYYKGETLEWQSEYIFCTGLPKEVFVCQNVITLLMLFESVSNAINDELKCAAFLKKAVCSKKNLTS